MRQKNWVAKVILFFIFSSFLTLFSQNYPKMGVPLNIPLDASGGFCELRSNHFHSGIDLRTQQREGVEIIAIEDGFVSRIGISHYGYGKVVYIKHPSGYVSVYAHASKFSPVIEKKVNELHYKLESYEMDVHLDSGLIPVKKGDVIAYSGNTGNSFGAHLHFEIRDAQTEETIIPYLFGIKVTDTKAPIIYNLRIYPLQPNSTINGKNSIFTTPVLLKSAGNYTLPEGTKIEIAGPVGFAIEANDVHNMSSFKNGLYQSQLKINNTPLYEVKFDKMAFSELRYINAYIDYAETLKSKKKYQRMYILTNDTLRNYNRSLGNGVVYDLPDGANKAEVIVKDFFGNIGRLNFTFDYAAPTMLYRPQPCRLPYCIPFDEEINFDKEDVKVKFPLHSLYENVNLNFSVSENVNSFGYPRFEIGSPYIPVHKRITVAFKLHEIAGIPLQKQLIAYINEQGKTRSYGGKLDPSGEWIYAETNDLGTYTIMADTLAPTIRSVNVSNGGTYGRNTSLKFKITDDLAGIAKYRLTMNGKFVLLEYEHKRNELFTKFIPSSIASGAQNVLLEVWDERGNKAEWSARITIL